MIGLGSDKRNVLRWEFFFFLKTSINRIGIKSFKIGLGDFASICLYWPKTAKKVLKLTFKGLKCPQQVRVEHKICSTMCGKSVHPILDHKNLVVLGLYKVILVTVCLKAQEVKRNSPIGCDTANELAWHRENVFIEVFLRDIF